MITRMFAEVVGAGDMNLSGSHSRSRWLMVVVSNERGVRGLKTGDRRTDAAAWSKWSMSTGSSAV